MSLCKDKGEQQHQALPGCRREKPLKKHCNGSATSSSVVRWWLELAPGGVCIAGLMVWNFSNHLSTS